MTVIRWVLPVLVVAWAVWGIYDYRQLKAALERGDRSALLREYRLTIAGEVVGGALALAAVGVSIFDRPPDLGLEVTVGMRSLVFGGLAGLVIGVVVPPIVARRTGKKPAPVTVGDIAPLVPVTRTERRWYALVALAAGVGEELVFRGFALRLLTDLGIDGWAALAVAAAAFGLVHVYQGVAGVALTAALGLFLSVVYVATGSLVAAMIVHAAVDFRLLVVDPAPTRPS